MAAATLKSIAEECGVSAQTVSRVLNPNFVHLYKKETCELIKSKVDELGYRPNAYAQAMKNGSFKSVMLLESSNSDFSFISNSMLYSIQNTLDSSGYNLMLNILPDEKIVAEDKLPRIFRENFVDGLLVGITRAIPEWLEQLLKSSNIPVVWVGSQHKNNCIYHDDFLSAYEVTKRLINLGHRKIAYVDYGAPENEKKVWHFSVTERMNGYLKALKDNNLEPLIVRPDSKLKPNEVVAYSEEYLIKRNHPTAIISYSMAKTGFHVLYALCRNGIQIPQDISFVTYHPDEVYANDLHISCIIPTKRDIGKSAVKLLVDKIQNNKLNPEPIVFPFDFIEGETIGDLRAETL